MFGTSNRKEIIFRFHVAICFLCTFMALCGAIQTEDAPCIASVSEFQPEWQPIFKGIDYLEVRKAAPDPLAVYAVRVDLTEPSVSFLVTPSNGEKLLETDGQKPSAFLKQYGCQVAINASPFDPVSAIEDDPRDILGLSVSRGDAYSRPHGDNPALLISKDNKVSFGTPPFDLGNVYNAAAGFGMLLENGKNTGANNTRHPRTAAGLSQDKHYLYLAVIDGRQDNYSVGASTEEAAQWMLQLGAYDALNLDGGGSTTLVTNDGKGGTQIRNRPIHNKMAPGEERVNGNHFGIYAQPLPRD